MWPWKWGQDHQNLITSLPCPKGVSVQVGQNPCIGSGDRVQTMLFFTVFIVWWSWKLVQGNPNLIKSFNYSNDTIHKVWPKSIIYFKRYGADKLFWSNFDSQSAGVSLKMRSRSPKSNHFFPMSQWCLRARLVKINLSIQEIECRQAHFNIYSLYSVVTLKIRSRSPKSNQIF